MKHKFRYVDKIDKPALSIHLAYGSAVHKAMEYLNNNIGKSPSLVDAFQAFHETWESELVPIKDKYRQEIMYMMALKTIEKYYAEYLEYEPAIVKYNEVDKIASECIFNVPIFYNDGREEPEYTLYGLMDIVASRDKKLFILDYKTAKAPYTPFKVKTSIQLTIYSYAIRWMLENGYFPYLDKKKEDYTLYHVMLKDYDSLVPNIVEHKKIVKDEDIQRLKYIMENVVKGIKCGIHIPNYTDQCVWCEYKKECLDFKGGI